MKLISADAFEMYLADAQLAWRDWILDAGDVLEAVMEALDEQPAVDAVEVVRCRDCKYREKWRGGYSCSLNGDYYAGGAVDGQDDEFCCYGERKEKDNG